MTLLFIACLFLVSCSAAPSGSDDGDLVIKDEFFIDDFVIYTSQNSIVRLYVPLQQFNFDGDDDTTSSEKVKENHTLFFVEADVIWGELPHYKGLSVLKNGKATKLVDNGRDAVANHENVVYIASEEGLYKYDEATNTAAPFGTIKDNIIQLAHNNKTNDIYLLTEDHKVLKLNKDGDGEVVPALKDVQVMVFGFEGNMYYYDSKNDVYVYDVEVAGSVPKKVEGSYQSSKLDLLSPMYGVENGALVEFGRSIYHIDPNASLEKLPVKFEAWVTASAPQPTLIQYYAKDNKIYELNIVLITLNEAFKNLKQALKPYVDKNKEAMFFNKESLARIIRF